MFVFKKKIPCQEVMAFIIDTKGKYYNISVV